MRVLLCHNKYQKRGGEDAAFVAERDLLASSGHDVVDYVRSNDELSGRSGMAAACQGIWSHRTWRDIRGLIARHQPQVVHCHNTFTVISPSVYWAAASMGVPVVQTLHNYRLVCANALLFREGVPCRQCVGKGLPWPAVRFACYRDNRAATAALVTMLVVHRLMGSWKRRVTQYIALSEFARTQLVAGGLPPGHISVLPNFSAETEGGTGRGSYILYAGRLSEEKGVRTLARAWQDGLDVPLKVAGEGPLEPLLRETAEANAEVEVLGWQSRPAMAGLLKGAAMVVVPSVCYEGFPMIAAEAFGRGVPLIVSRLGGLQELVSHGETGYAFSPGDPRALSEAVRRAWGRDAATIDRMSQACCREHQQHLSAEAHVKALEAIYATAIRKAQAPG